MNTFDITPFILEFVKSPAAISLARLYHGYPDDAIGTLWLRLSKQIRRTHTQINDSKEWVYVNAYWILKTYFRHEASHRLHQPRSKENAFFKL